MLEITAQSRRAALIRAMTEEIGVSAIGQPISHAIGPLVQEGCIEFSNRVTNVPDKRNIATTQRMHGYVWLVIASALKILPCSGQWSRAQRSHVHYYL